MVRLGRLQELIQEEAVQVALLLLFAVTVFFCRLGQNGMANFDDCFYAEKAKEILQNHDGWVITYNHRPAFENPPLYFWLTSLAYRVFGIGVYAAKFTSALMGVLTVLLLYRLGKYLFDRRTGFFAAFILSTTYLFVKYGRHGMLDVTLSFFTVAAYFSLMLALRKDKRFFLLWGFCVGSAVLVKSVLGLFPVVVTILFLGRFGHRKKFMDPFFLAGCLIALVWGGSWFLQEYARFGNGFLKVHFGWLIFQRGFTLDPRPWYDHLDYLKDMLVFYWPWLPLMLMGWWVLVQAKFWQKEELGLLALWVFIVIAVMSYMNVHMFWYVLPAYPALALIAALGLERSFDGEVQQRWVRRIACFCFGGTLLLNALPISLDQDRELDTRLLAPAVKYFGDQGTRVIALREDYYGLNNALLFFSDHAAEPTYSNVADVKREFKAKQLVLCVAHRGDLDELQKSKTPWYPVRYTGDLVLIANRKLDLADIPTRRVYE